MNAKRGAIGSTVMMFTDQQFLGLSNLSPRVNSLKSKGWLVLLALVMILWVASIVATGAGFNPLSVNWNFANSGEFGDSFGPLSAFMAAAAAVAAVLAWSSQKEDIERAKQTDEVNRQSALVARDENTLFQMIALLRQIVSGIDIHLQSGKIKAGHDAIAHIISRIPSGGSDAVGQSYRLVFEKYRNDLGHYLRLSYNIFAFISNSHLADKYFYAKLVRAILSDSELALLALNCAYGEGKIKYGPLVEEFCLLNNLSNDLVDQFHLLDKFNASAFDRSASREE